MSIIKKENEIKKKHERKREEFNFFYLDRLALINRKFILLS